MSTEIISTSADYWSTRVSSSTKRRPTWITEQKILHYLNVRSCGEPLPGRLDGFHANIRRLIPSAACKAISIGCGAGHKEIALLKKGLVEHIDAYDISTASIAKAQELAAEAGVSSQVSFHLLGDGKLPNVEDYGLVHWSSALHHMLDVHAAVQWSHKVLMKGGLFACDEYVGPARLQFSKLGLKVSDRFRSALPERYFLDEEGALTIKRKTPRIDLDNLIKADPTEAAQSDLILTSISKVFDGATIINLGGGSYDLVFRNILQNFTAEDEWLIDIALIIDDLLARKGVFHIAQAYAIKA